MTLIKIMSLTPLSVSTALDVPEFYQNKQQFWHMLGFLFTNYQNKPVWEQVPTDAYYKLGEQLWHFANAIESEAEFNAKGQTIYRTYYTIMRITRGNRSNSAWHAYSSPEFLQAMYRLYRQMYSVGTIPNLPLFGHIDPKL